MKFNSYIVSETKTAFSVPLQTHLLTSNKTFKQKAFTLAETLITLSIIGVVAAMTVPTLVTNAQKASHVAGLKKAYSTIQNAIRMIPSTENCPAGDYDCANFNLSYGRGNIILGGIPFPPNYADKQIYLLSKNLKTRKIYLNQSINFTSYEDSQIINGGCPYPLLTTDKFNSCLTTEDGMIIGATWGALAVDINGEKGPNKPGLDQFYFFITDGNHTQQGLLVPVGSKQATNVKKPSGYGLSWNYWKDKCTTQNLAKYKRESYMYMPDENLQTCTGRVLETGKMDY